MQILRTFDEQMSTWRERLRDEIGLSEWQLRKPASCVYEEVTHFEHGLRLQLLNSSPVPIGQRLREIEWFIYFNARFGHLVRDDPGFARAYTIVSNYISFVYPGDTVYRILAEHSLTNSASYSLGHFLRAERLRDFRHALAHGHWAINTHGTGIEYWPRPNSTVPLEVTQDELIYWYVVSRATVFAALAGAERAAG